MGGLSATVLFALSDHTVHAAPVLGRRKAVLADGLPQEVFREGENRGEGGARGDLGESRARTAPEAPLKP